MLQHWLTGDWIYNLFLGSLGTAIGTLFTSFFFMLFGLGTSDSSTV